MSINPEIRLTQISSINNVRIGKLRGEKESCKVCLQYDSWYITLFLACMTHLFE